MIINRICCKYSKETRDEMLIANSKFSGNCILVERKINTFQVVKVFVVIPRDGNVNLHPRKLSVCTALRSSSFFLQKVNKISSKNRMEWISLF